MALQLPMGPNLRPPWQPLTALSQPASLVASYAAQQHPQAAASYRGQPGNAYDGTGQPSAAYLSMSQGAVANANSTPPLYERTPPPHPGQLGDDPYKRLGHVEKVLGARLPLAGAQGKGLRLAWGGKLEPSWPSLGLLLWDVQRPKWVEVQELLIVSGFSGALCSAWGGTS